MPDGDRDGLALEPVVGLDEAALGLLLNSSIDGEVVRAVVGPLVGSCDKLSLG